MKYLVLLFAMFMLAGCNLQGPLTDRPTRDVDEALLGSWFSLTDGSSLDIYRLSKSEYMVISGGDPYVCTHSTLAGIDFISCRQIKNQKESYGTYAYVAYELKKGVLTIFALNDSLKLTGDQPPAQLRSIIEAAARAGKALNTGPGGVTHYKKVPSQ